MRTFFWTLTILGTLAGFSVLVLTVNGARSAPQEAAGAAIAIAFAVIPYCLARAVSEIIDPTNK